MIDPVIVVSIGGANPAVIEHTLHLPWSRFAAKLAAPPPESEDKTSRGWYSCVEFDPAYRHGENFKARYALTFDYDSIKRDDVAVIQQALDPFAYVMYTTHSHKAEAPRLRVVLPLSRAVDATEFQAVSRKIAQRAGIELAARESHVPAQMMYLPVRWPGAQFKSVVHPGAPVPVDETLAEYTDWHDHTSWPRRAAGDEAHAAPENITPPTEKPGIVGDFCRAIDVYEAIRRFGLPYTATATKDRLTYTKGSRPEGAVVYDNATKLHSHHDTDPARGQNNAFDLVRLHKFGVLDGDGNSPITQRPSYLAMCSLALDQPELRQQVIEEFEVIPVEVAQERVDENTISFNVQPTRFRFKKVGEFTQGVTPGWIIKRHWPAQSFVLEIGAPGDGKTFSVLDKCAAVALGVEEWNGLRVRKGRVAYVCAEGAGGFRTRLRAYEIGHGVALDTTSLTVLDTPPNLYASEADRQGLIAAIEALGGVDVIVLDTVAATSAGANENSSDMSTILAYYTSLIKTFNCTVVAIHHVGKDPSKGARGFSGIKAAADAEITTDSDATGVRTVTVSKMKDGAEGAQYNFKLKVVDVETDDDGDPVTSCILDYDVKPTVYQRRPTSGAKERVFDMLMQMGARYVPVALEPICAELLAKYGDGQTVQPARVKRVIDALIDDNFVTRSEINGVDVFTLFGGVAIPEESDE